MEFDCNKCIHKSNANKFIYCKECSTCTNGETEDTDEFCKDNETGNVSLEMDVDGHTLVIDILFKIKEEEWRKHV